MIIDNYLDIQSLKAEEEAKNKESREKTAHIAYRKWLNLRKQNKYKSMVTFSNRMKAVVCVFVCMYVCVVNRRFTFLID